MYFQTTMYNLRIDIYIYRYHNGLKIGKKCYLEKS